MKKHILLTVLGGFLAFNYTNAQVTYAKPEEFKEIKKRTLIVQMLEEHPDDIADMQKKIDKEKKADKKAELEAELKAARAFVTDYNKYMKEAVEKHWGLNAKVEYKTVSEVAALRKSKSTNYTVLFYSESSSQRRDANGFRYFPELSIPTLNYSRIESGTVKVDYSYFIQFAGFRSEGGFRMADAVMSLKMMKNHIAEIEKQSKKNYTFKEYAEDQAKANCSQAKGKTVKMSRNSVHKKSTEDELRQDYTVGK
ncbi:MAG TPA: hypothetical protein VD905_02855, partial [Flavobacteriales bacterium]|nr:hypothetical protein [Flavobacteriales bacterium]